ncbi:MAG: DUF1559 domain-containing protein [Fuerstiella sp.]|nr:DUF1559 domain-containing protein [Fuerstiella sp.]MCP4853293.1 DUF1559 domain-containing protein [Fuerstiella sp.]
MGDDAYRQLQLPSTARRSRSQFQRAVSNIIRCSDRTSDDLRRYRAWQCTPLDDRWHFQYSDGHGSLWYQHRVDRASRQDVEINPISVNASSERIDHSDSIMSSYHQGGAQVLLADGSARFVSEHTDPAVLSALLTKAGGEITGDW